MRYCYLWHVRKRLLNSLRPWDIFHVILSSADFFQNQLFRKFFQCQTDWIQIRPDILSGLIWAQTVCISYQQTLLIAPAKFFIFFCRLLIFSKNYFRNYIRVSNRLVPDQAPYFVGPDLSPNCLLKLSADDTSR